MWQFHTLHFAVLKQDRLSKSGCTPKEGQLVSALLLLMPRLLRGCHWISPEDNLKFTTAFLPCTCKHQNPFRNTIHRRAPHPQGNVLCNCKEPYSQG